MKLYVIERDNPLCKPEPEVLTDGNKAKDIVLREYKNQMSELGTDQEIADDGLGGYGCYCNFDEESYCGDCLIDSDYDSDRWEWRITEHEIQC